MRLGVDPPAPTPADRVRVFEEVLRDHHGGIRFLHYLVPALAASPPLATGALRSALSGDPGPTGLRACFPTFTTNLDLVDPDAIAALIALVPFHAVSAESLRLASSALPFLVAGARFSAPAIGSADCFAVAFALLGESVPVLVFTALRKRPVRFLTGAPRVGTARARP